MFNKKEIAELQRQVQELQNKPETPSIAEDVKDLSLRLVRMTSAIDITLIYQDERIQKLEKDVEKLEALTKKLVEYAGMTEGHLR